MIRGFVRLLIRRLLHRIIEFTLRLFLLFGFRFDLCNVSVSTTTTSTNQKEKPPASAVASRSIVSETDFNHSLIVSKRIAAVISFFCLRLPLLLGAEPQGRSLWKHYVSSTDTTSAQFRKCKLPCGAVVFNINAERRGESTPSSSPFGIVVYVGAPWDCTKDLESHCLHLAVATQRDVVLVIASFTDDNISVHEAANSVLLKMVSASQFLSASSLTIVASSYACSILLHAVLRAPFQDGIPPIRGILLVDPLVALTPLLQKSSSTTESPPNPSLDGESLGLTAACLKRALVGGAISACGQRASSRSGPSASPTSSNTLLDWFPPLLDDTFSVPLLVVYDPDGPWAPEMVSYLSRWSECNGLVEGLTYHTPSKFFTPKFMSNDKCAHSHLAASDTAATPSFGASPTLDIVCSHITLWITDVSGGFDDDASSSRPMSACSTPWANSSRSRPFADTHQKTSVDSMDGVFSRFPPQQRPSVTPPVAHQPKATPSPQSTFSIGCILRNIAALPKNLNMTPSRVHRAGESERVQNHSLMETPPLWKPSPGEHLPRVASSGLHLDSLDCHPALKGIPNVFSRSLGSDDLLFGSGTEVTTPQR